MPILVTGALGPAGASLLGQLSRRGVPAIGVDLAASPRQRSCRPVPAAGDAAFGPALAAVVRETGARLIVPTVSEELPVLTEPQSRASLGASVLLGPAEAVGIADDKLATCRTLARGGVAVPKHRRGDDVRDVGAVESHLGLPYLGKPRVGRGARGVVVYQPGDQPPIGDPTRLLQEFVPGTEYAVQLYLPTGPHAPETVVLAKTALAGGDVGNGITLVRTKAADVAMLALRAVRCLRLTGPVDIDVRRRANSEPVVLEVNARFGAHSALAPELLTRLLAEHRSELPRRAA